MRPSSVTTSNAASVAKNSTALVLDYYGRPEVALQVVVTGSATWTVQQTLDNVLDANATITWFDHPDTNMVAQTVSRQGNYAYIPAAVRLRQTAGAGSATLTVIQAGLHP